MLKEAKKFLKQQLKGGGGGGEAAAAAAAVIAAAPKRSAEPPYDGPLQVRVAGGCLLRVDALRQTSPFCERWCAASLHF